MYNFKSKTTGLQLKDDISSRLRETMCHYPIIQSHLKLRMNREETTEIRM